MKFCRMAAALEEIAETVETNLEAGQPLEPSTAMMLTTAIDAGGVGEPMGEVVANEAFEFSGTAATESFVDSLKDRAKRVWSAMAKFARKAWEVTTQKLKRIADAFRTLGGIYNKLEKEGEILASAGNKPFQNSKWEAAIQSTLYAPASTKTVVAAVDNALTEYREVLKIVDGKLAGDLRSLKTAWRGEKAESVIAVMNKVLTSARPLAEMNGTRFKHSSVMVEVNLPTNVSLQNTGGLEGSKVTYEDGLNDFAAGIKTATIADIKHLKQTAEAAANALDAAWANYRDVWKDEADGGSSDFAAWLDRGNFSEEKGDTTRKLLVKYTNLMRVVTDLTNATVYGSAEGVYSNHRTAAKWIRFSIAEGKAAARGGK
jgi:hypothetical protein